MRWLSKVPATKLDDLSSIPWASMMEGENWLLHVILWFLHRCHDTHKHIQHTSTRTHINKCNLKRKLFKAPEEWHPTSWIYVVCVYCVCVHMCACACRSQRSTSQHEVYLPQSFSTLFSETRILTEPWTHWLDRLACRWVPGLCLSQLTQHGLHTCAALPGFCMSDGNSSSGLHTCATNTLTTEPSPQPRQMNLISSS